MVYAFTEAEKKKIEKTGIMVIQFKCELKMVEKCAEVCRKAIRLFNDAVNKICELVDKFRQLLDDVRYAIEELVFRARGRNSSRYKMVRIISKCTGIERHCVWKMTRPVYLARSRC